MRRPSNAADYRKLADKYRRIAVQLPADAEVWHKEIAKAAYDDLKGELLTGKVPTKQLRKEGHPFAKNRLKKAGAQKKGLLAARALLPINRQSGRLLGELYLYESLLIGLQSFELASAAPHAKYILDPRGTKKMMGRGVMTGHLFGLTEPGEIERRWRARKKIFNNKFIRKMENP
jgi:hypothetical protein